MTWAAFSYLALLAVFTLSLRLIGESWWITGMALYFPRVLFLGPLVVLVPAAFALKLSRVLWCQIAAVGLVLFPLMGFVVPRPRASASASGPQIRLLSYNVNSCAAGADALVERVRSYDPDIVLFQELCQRPRALTARLRETYPVVRVTGQFLIATRFPLIETEDAAAALHYREHRFARYELETSLGRIALYNLHPLSPRWAFYAAKGMRVRTSLKNGTFLRGGAAEESMRDNFRWREEEIAAAAKRANQDSVPRILAGDTNLPDLSPLLSRYLSNYQDGFERSSWGFGYTYPVRLPWMRIDRVFASQELRFNSFQIGCEDDSDHHCVIAQLERSGP